ncbi:MAG: hypothetical protein ACP5E9_06860 [Candidatus Methanospirareceae archaeon]
MNRDNDNWHIGRFIQEKTRVYPDSLCHWRYRHSFTIIANGKERLYLF